MRQLDGTVWRRDVHRGSAGESPTRSLVNSKSGPTLADRQKILLCVSLRSCVNQVTLEYILCGSPHFVDLVTKVWHVLFFKKMYVLCANSIMKWYLIKEKIHVMPVEFESFMFG